MTKFRSFISIEVLIGFVFVLLMFIMMYPPVIKPAIDNVTPTMDSAAAAILSFVPAAFLIAIIVGIFAYAFGRSPPGRRVGV